MRRLGLWLIVMGLLSLACRGLSVAEPATLVPTIEVTAEVVVMPTVPLVVPTTAVASSTVTPVPDNGTVVTQPSWPAAVPLLTGLVQTAADEAQTKSLYDLQVAIPPQRDDISLMQVYQGAPAVPPAPPLVTEPLAVGATAVINVLNHDDNTMTPVDMVLKGVGEHAYFWFDEGPGSVEPDPDSLAEKAAAFDTIYEQVVATFGTEDNPGVDGDPRIHIINVSPLILCNVTLASAGSCGLAGYFSVDDTLPQAIIPHSNEREMFVMNGANFEASFYLSVLGHEFRHMVENRYDQGDLDWEVEGSAVLAQDLLGFSSSARGRANSFLQNPDRQLTAWSDSDTSPRYGQGYLFNRYLYDRLGADLYRVFGQSALPGFAALDEMAMVNGLEVTGESLWFDWLVALAVHRRPEAPAIYDFNSNVNQAAMTRMGPGEQLLTDVRQYAADYYELTGEGSVRVDFTGSTVVPVLSEGAASGRGYWYAQRANYSQMRLSRAFDLTAVDTATLQYDVYTDIEYGYDFAYLLLSADEGATWQPLVGEQMAGLLPADNPSERALADRFYTGQGLGWRAESIDLSPWAGQNVWLRFEYVTDPILTFDGFALDNITIPEIGFADDGESEGGGWLAEGFSQVTAEMAQPWQVQLVTFPGGEVVVTRLTLSALQTGSWEVDLGASEVPPILIVAAHAPLSLVPGVYELAVGE